MAEGFFNAAAASDPDIADLFSAVSAGIYALEGQPASPHSMEAMLEGWDIDISRHRARNVSPANIQDSFLVLTMTEAHKKALLEQYHNHTGKIFTLNEYASNINTPGIVGWDITDPFGMSLEVYRKCAAEINQAIITLVKKLKTKVI